VHTNKTDTSSTAVTHN